MTQKIRVALICGGTSCEHEISLLSAKNVMQALCASEYELVPIFIDKKGSWHFFEAKELLEKSPKELLEHASFVQRQLDKTSHVPLLPDRAIDVAFPLLHGPFGEDGTVQGFLKLARIPFVGASVLGSSIGMDKDVMKRLLEHAGIRVSRFQTIHVSEKNSIDCKTIIKSLGLPLFVKPANLGSSVGITKVKTEDMLVSAIDEAFLYDTKVIIEEAILGRELECSVLGNSNPKASVVGEFRTKHEFYDYTAKYIDNDAEFDVPAQIPDEVQKTCQEIAVKVFRTLCCEGMARVDFFLQADGALLVNEINTIPGFTNISMYPRLWQASGLSYNALLEELISLAIDRHKKECALKSSVSHF
jgi:D-alanine-D-alanine ligase